MPEKGHWKIKCIENCKLARQYICVYFHMHSNTHIESHIFNLVLRVIPGCAQVCAYAWLCTLGSLLVILGTIISIQCQMHAKTCVI